MLIRKQNRAINKRGRSLLLSDEAGIRKPLCKNWTERIFLYKHVFKQIRIEEITRIQTRIQENENNEHTTFTCVDIKTHSINTLLNVILKYSPFCGLSGSLPPEPFMPMKKYEMLYVQGRHNFDSVRWL